MTRSATVALMAVAVALTCVPVITAAGHTTLAAETASVDEGESTTVAVTLSSIPDGLSGFNVTVEVADTETARITEATVGFGLDSTAIESDGSTVVLKGIDTADQYQAGDGKVQLATVTLEGESAGRTALTLSVDQVDDEDGDRIAPARSDGELTVEQQTTATPADGEETPTVSTEMPTDNEGTPADSTETPVNSDGTTSGSTDGATSPGGSTDGATSGDTSSDSSGDGGGAVSPSTATGTPERTVTATETGAATDTPTATATATEMAVITETETATVAQTEDETETTTAATTVSGTEDETTTIKTAEDTDMDTQTTAEQPEGGGAPAPNDESGGDGSSLLVIAVGGLVLLAAAVGLSRQLE